ncbi:MAG: HNH endonuclease [Planctomycetaceae bacterium]|nr:HNH endonuclease [Planctomycetaceae bacterium]
MFLKGAFSRSAPAISLNDIEAEELDIEAEELSVQEGMPSIRQHLRRERDRTIVAAKRRQVLSAIGQLARSVCGFDFRKFYGELGAEFCEVHHLRSLADADGEVLTRLEDLAVVCSNCHRMLHRSHPFLTLEQLKSTIRKARRDLKNMKT